MHAIIRDGRPEIVKGAFTDNAGVKHPAHVLQFWTPEELSEIGVHPVMDAEIPQGHVATGSSLHWDGETVTQVFETEPAPPPVPETVSRFQARAALLQAGRLGDAEAAVAKASDPLLSLAWAEAIEWKRSSPALNALAEGIGMTQDEIDDLFRAAALIEA